MVRLQLVKRSPGPLPGGEEWFPSLSGRWLAEGGISFHHQGLTAKRDVEKRLSSLSCERFG